MLLSRLVLASALLLAGPSPAPRPGPTAEPAAGAIVLELDGQPVTRARYRQVVADAEPSWQRLLALPDAERRALIGLRTREETAFVEEYAAPELMRSIFADQDEDRKRRADEMHRRALAGDDWRSLVREYTLEPRGVERGGRTGARTWLELPRPLGRHAFAARVGEILPPVLTPFGWHVARVDAVYPARDGQPERREISQAVLAWSPGRDAQGQEHDLRAVIADQIQRRLVIQVIDRRLCSELPNICAQNAQEATGRTGAAAAADVPGAASRGDAAGER